MSTYNPYAQQQFANVNAVLQIGGGAPIPEGLAVCGHAWPPLRCTQCMRGDVDTFTADDAVRRLAAGVFGTFDTPSPSSAPANGELYDPDDDD